jgi:hypothetical protein
MLLAADNAAHTYQYSWPSYPVDKEIRTFDSKPLHQQNPLRNTDHPNKDRFVYLLKRQVYHIPQRLPGQLL